MQTLHTCSVRVLEATDADTERRMRRGDADAVRHEARSAARRTVDSGRGVVLDRPSHLGLRDREPAEHEDRKRDREERPPAPGEEGDARESNEERGETR